MLHHGNPVLAIPFCQKMQNTTLSLKLVMWFQSNRYYLYHRKQLTLIKRKQHIHYIYTLFLKFKITCRILFFLKIIRAIVIIWKERISTKSLKRAIFETRQIKLFSMISEIPWLNNLSFYIILKTVDNMKVEEWK